MLYDILFRRGDKYLDFRRVAAIDDVLCRQQMCGGDDDRAELAARGDQHPVFPAAVEHTHHVIALFHACGNEEIDGAVARFADVAESHYFFFTRGIAPDQRAFFGREARIFVHYVIAEIEVFGHGEADVLREIVIVCEIGAVEKP